jgi:lysophospholipase L1-like esterase
MTNRVAVAIALGIAMNAAAQPRGARAPAVRWIGTWAASPQPAIPSAVETFRNQTLRLIVHVSAGGTKARVKIANIYGDRPLVVGAAHVARRRAAADVDPSSDRTLSFRSHSTATIAPRSADVSDPVDLDVAPLSDLAISLFLPESTAATTTHVLALQTSYVSDGDSTGAAVFPVAKTIATWPFLTGVDIAGSPRAAAIVAFGSSTTDGDGSTKDANRRWPDVLAERLRDGGGAGAELGVLNEGIIGNRLLHDSPRAAGNPFGPSLGEAGVARFARDVLAQSGVKYVFIVLGVNDILFPGFPFTPPSETVAAGDLIAGYRRLVARAHAKGVRVVATTIPPFEDSLFASLNVTFYTPERERSRQAVNAWIRTGGAFDGVVDFDEILRDPNRPTKLLPRYDAGDHLHVNDAGNVAEANAIPLSLLQR